MLSIEQAIFYLFSGIVIFSSSMVICAKNPVRAVLFLVLTFFATAGVWMLLEAQFLSVTLVLVYVGAVMVLFLFVVMMLDVELASIREGFSRFLPLGIAVAGLIIVGLTYGVGEQKFGLTKVSLPGAQAVDYSDVEKLGTLLYTHYLYAVEIAGVILLVAIISAISLTFRKRQSNKAPDPGWQVKIRKEDRVKLIQMDQHKDSP